MDQKTINLEGKIAGYEKKTLLVTAFIIIVALGAFYAGAKYEKHKLSALGLLVNKSANKKPVANSIKGVVTSKDDTSVTIKMVDGTTKNIPFSGSLTFGKDGVGSAADISTGELIIITGENNADGIFVPTNIRISKNSPKAPVTTAPDGTVTPGTTTPAPTTQNQPITKMTEPAAPTAK